MKTVVKITSFCKYVEKSKAVQLRKAPYNIIYISDLVAFI